MLFWLCVCWLLCWFSCGFVVVVVGGFCVVLWCLLFLCFCSFVLAFIWVCLGFCFAVFVFVRHLWVSLDLSSQLVRK